MIKAEINIGIDNKGDRWFSVRGKDPKLPFGRELQTLAPVEIPVSELNTALEAFRDGRREDVNRILSQYY